MPIGTPLTTLPGCKASDPVGADGCDCRRPPDHGGERRRRFGILGGGYGERRGWKPETAKLKKFSGAVRHRLHHMEPCQAARAARHRARGKAARDHAVLWRSKAVCAAHQIGRRAVDLPGAGRGDGAAGARRRRRHPGRAGHRGGRPWRVPHHDRHRAGDHRSRCRARAGRRRRRDCRWPRARRDDDARGRGRAARYALLCQRRVRRRGRSQEAHLRRRQRAIPCAASSSTCRATMSGRRRLPAAA